MSNESCGCGPCGCGAGDVELSTSELDPGITREDVKDYYGKAGASPKEQLCCPFLTFTLKGTPGTNEICLKLTGETGTKEVLAAGFDAVALNNISVR